MCTKKPLRRFLQLLSSALVCGALLTGCASTAESGDPIEGLNRSVYAMNKALDTAILKPIAKGYQAVMPDPVDTAITNFFSNLGDIVVAVNNLLQLKLLKAIEDGARFTINSTLGMAGFIDVASEIGIDKNQEDFGQTLGYWGIGNGPYIVLPFFGPSTIRDATGRLTDATLFDPIFFIDDVPVSNGVLTAKTIDVRADLLGVGDIVDEAALDEYSFIRDAYLQRRRNLVYDGNPPFQE